MGGKVVIEAGKVNKANELISHACLLFHLLSPCQFIFIFKNKLNFPVTTCYPIARLELIRSLANYA